MPNSDQRMLRVAAARADFLESGRSGAAGVPEALAASWERSQSAGVDAHVAHSQVRHDIDPGSLLVRCARPVLTQLGNDTADLPLVIALTDHNADVVQRIDTSPAVGRLLDRVDFAPGYSYAEGQMGTNGVGTVFETGRSVSVVGPEHFAESLQSFACTGAPIVDPITGRVEGVLDISALVQTWSPLMHTLAKSAAMDISRNLLLDHSQSQQAIFDTYLRADTKSSRHPVFAFGETISMANAAAQREFAPAEQQAIRDHATFLMHRRETASDSFELATGRVVQIRGTRIVVGSEVAGVVVTAEVVTGHLVGSPSDFTEHVVRPVAISTAQTSRLAGDLNRSHDDTIAVGRSAAWVRARAELRDAMAERRPTIVLGETGAGKFTLVAEVFHETHASARSISIDAREVDGVETVPDLDTVLTPAADVTVCIVRDLDEASTEAVEKLDALLGLVDGSDGRLHFVATLSDSSLDSDLPFHALLKYFDIAVTVPPLRLRSEDIGEVTRALLRNLAPQRRVRLSPDAERVVAQYSWPRNISQLRDALQHALRQRPVGELQAVDLPAYCRTTTRRTLTPLEAAERDAIVAALQELGGNRVAAAAHLGMSRSSLYRKIKTYGITA